MEYQPITKINHPQKQHKLSTSVIIITTLYFIQGIPLGFFGTLPVLWLTQNAENTDSSSQLSLLTLISYPFSFKIFFAPIQDMYYSSSFGRRKSYIIPAQYILSFLSLFFAYSMENCVENSTPFLITFLGIVMCVLNAIQDIGTDGWVLTILPKEHVGWGSVCQNVGQILGTTLGGPVFIALNSQTFCNNFIFSTTRDTPLLTIHQFFIIFGIFTLIFTFLIHLFTYEKPVIVTAVNNKQLSVVITTFKGFYKNKNIRFLMFLLVTWRLGFALMLAPAPYILLQKNFSKELLSSLSVMMIPVDLTMSFMVGKFVKHGNEFKLFFIQFAMRLFDGIFVYFICSHFQADSMVFWLPIIISSETLCRIYTTANFVNFGAFFNRISDDDVGGTYITALNSCHNLGNQLAISIAIILFAHLDYKIMMIIGLTYELLYILIFYKKILRLQTQTKAEWKIDLVNKDF